MPSERYKCKTFHYVGKKKPSDMPTHFLKTSCFTGQAQVQQTMMENGEVVAATRKAARPPKTVTSKAPDESADSITEVARELARIGDDLNARMTRRQSPLQRVGGLVVLIQTVYRLLNVAFVQEQR